MADEVDRVLASTEQWLDSAPDGVVIVDAEGLIRFVNRHVEHIFGYEASEMMGKPVEILMPERSWPDHSRHRDVYFASPVRRPMGAQSDLAGRRKDGAEFPVDVSLSVLETVDGLMVSAAIRDITWRKRLEAQLHNFEAIARLAAIVESSQDAIIGKTLDGVITSWNSGAEHMYGYVAEEIIGRNISEIIPDALADELVGITARIKRGERVRNFDTQRVAKNGQVLDVSVAISPIRDADGNVIGASTVGRDMTQVIRAESVRRALEAGLHQGQRLESLGQLAGGIAHDFNNLLAGIMNYAALVRDILNEELRQSGVSGENLLTTARDDVEQITAIAKRAAALTRQLLTFSRREVLQAQILDLNAVVAEMEQLLRRTIGQNVHRLHTALAADRPTISIDRGQIEQVIMNLAVNARDSMPDGGTLGIATSVVEIDDEHANLRRISAGTYVQLSVSDTGTGMSSEVAARAFEPFFSTRPTGEGTGLGLATVFGIVTQAGGEVVIDSELGVGTTVFVNIPASFDPPVQAPTPQNTAQSANRETVLLVEDEDIVRDPTRRLLSRSGYTVLVARNTDEALEIEANHPGTIDLLLTDVVMPGRSGKDLSIEVLKRRPTTRVLFMSGYSENVIVHEGVLEDGVCLIEKPFATDDLLGAIRRVLDGGG